jgi:hypothetical protein
MQALQPRIVAIVVAFAAALLPLCAGIPPTPARPLTAAGRQALLHEFASSTPYATCVFPLGKIGLRLQNGVLSPSGEQLDRLVEEDGAAARPGDAVRITNIRFLKNGIVFEVNGGPPKHGHWLDHLEINAGAVATTGGEIAHKGEEETDETLSRQSGQKREPSAKAGGTFVYLAFGHGVPELTVEEVRRLLAPVLDFQSLSPAEAYVKTLPKPLAEAVKSHQPLVGMDRRMVLFVMGHPTLRHRERVSGVDFEEWIYNEPPAPVYFLRFLGERLRRIEIAESGRARILRTEDELAKVTGKPSFEETPAVPSGSTSQPSPTLLRPAESAGKPAKPAGGAPVESPAPR